MTVRYPTHWLCAIIGHKIRRRPPYLGFEWSSTWCARCHNYPCTRRFYRYPS
jgi:hypothetical protein